MSVTSNRVVGIQFTGDVDAPNLAYSAAANISSPGEIDSVLLALGANTISVPAGAVAVTIIPPAGNTATVILKGVVGDSGVYLHLTDPTSLGIYRAGSSTFVLTVSANITVRLIWS